MHRRLVDLDDGESLFINTPKRPANGLDGLASTISMQRSCLVKKYKAKVLGSDGNWSTL